MTPFFSDDQVALYHGDYREVLPALDARYDAIVTDPPYGETALEWDRWQDGWPTDVRAWLKPHGSLWCFGSMRMFFEHLAEFDGWRFAQDVVWEKHNGSGFAADRFKRVHEHAIHWYPDDVAWGDVYVHVPTERTATHTVRRINRGPTAHLNSIGDSAYIDDGTRLVRSVLQVRSMHGKAIHPTEKPPGVLCPLIEFSVPTGGTVLDPFAGSGSTGDAARQLGRHAVLIEANGEYVEQAARRLAQGTLPFAQETS